MGWDAPMNVLKKSQLLTDEYSVKILMATTKTPRSAQWISDRYDIPIAACYRRIKDLETHGLIECHEKKLSQKGKRVAYYMSPLKKALLFFEDGHLRVKFQMIGEDNGEGEGWKELSLKDLRDDGDPLGTRDHGVNA
jgi:DNA-binding HxlR family transcriptional regulator